PRASRARRGEGRADKRARVRRRAERPRAAGDRRPRGRRRRDHRELVDVAAFESADAFEAWLERSHDESAGIWLKIAKKGSGAQTVTYAEAVEAALCFGWVDGQKQRLDEHYWLQRFTPRSPRSRWSKINREKAEWLIAAGRMRAAGKAEVDRARADGRWDAAYDGSRTATVPDDLQRELDAD